VFNAFPLNLISIFENLRRIPTGPWGFITVLIPIPMGIPIPTAALTIHAATEKSDLNLELMTQPAHRTSMSLACHLVARTTRPRPIMSRKKWFMQSQYDCIYSQI